jgi:hypothetical protein
MTAIPPAGPYCPDNCMEYPFPDILLYYPRDYFWMYIAIFQLFAFVIFIVTIHFTVECCKKALYFSQRLIRADFVYSFIDGLFYAVFSSPNKCNER